MRTKTETKKTTDALAILDRMAGGRPKLRRLTEEARANAAVAQLTYAARNQAGPSQVELAERIGTQQSVVSRLEDADYEGHSVSMLHRIAAALVERGIEQRMAALATSVNVAGRRIVVFNPLPLPDRRAVGEPGAPGFMALYP